MSQAADIQAAIEAAERGERAAAALRLAEVLRADPGSEIAWWWLARCVDDPERRAYCLRRVLALNPLQVDARQALAALAGAAPVSPAPRLGAAIGDAPRTSPETHTAPRGSSEPPPPMNVHPVEAATTAAPARRRSLQSATRRANGSRLGVAGLVGLLCVLIACGLPVLYLILSGTLRQWIAPAPADVPTAVAALPTATPPASPTAQPTARATPTTSAASPTPRPTATLSPAEIDQLRLDARQLMFQQDYDAALAIWDRVLAAAPDDGEAHYRRAQIYQELLAGETYLDLYLDHLNRGLEEINQALALGPLNGDFFLMRKALLLRLAYAQETRANFDVYGQAALDDLRQAVRLGNHETASPIDESLGLMRVGRCEEGLTLARTLAADAAAEYLERGVQYALAVNELCLGQLNPALAHIDKAVVLSSRWEYTYTRAIILYERGDLEAAAAELDRSIEESPFYCGCRYFLRALIRLDQGRLEDAAADLDAGYGQTWDHTGVYLYVQGRLALADGHEAEGWQLIQKAEASLERLYESLRQRILRELDQAGVPPLAASATVSFNPPEPAALPVIPSLADDRWMPLNPGRLITLSDGLGPLLSYANSLRAYHAAPTSALPEGSVAMLSISVLGVPRAAIGDYEYRLWDQVQGGWVRFSPAPGGTLEVPEPTVFVSPAGDVFFLIDHSGSKDRQISQISVALSVRQADGTLLRVGIAP